MARKCPASGKTKFASKRNANDFCANRLNESGIRLRVYLCESCSEYHITKIIQNPISKTYLKHYKDFKKYIQ